MNSKIIVIILSFINICICEDGHLIEVTRSLQTKCNLISCPSQKGYCKSDECICYKGYITYNEKDSEKFCSYHQKNSFFALLLEAFGLIGFGHLYSGRIFAGFIKILYFYLIICCGTQFVIQFMKENAETDLAYRIKMIISLVFLATPLIWHFIDLYNYVNTNYKDGNGMPMINW